MIRVQTQVGCGCNVASNALPTPSDSRSKSTNYSCLHRHFARVDALLLERRSVASRNRSLQTLGLVALVALCALVARQRLQVISL